MRKLWKQSIFLEHSGKQSIFKLKKKKRESEWLQGKVTAIFNNLSRT